MNYQDEKEPITLTTRTPTGEYYLQGFADGYHNRPRVKQRSQRAQEAYTKGYDQGERSREQGRKA